MRLADGRIDYEVESEECDAARGDLVLITAKDTLWPMVRNIDAYAIWRKPQICVVVRREHLMMLVRPLITKNQNWGLAFRDFRFEVL